MEAFIWVIFWLKAITAGLRLLNLATGAYKQQVSIGVYAADTVLTVAIAIWAHFVLWYAQP